MLLRPRTCWSPSKSVVVFSRGALVVLCAAIAPVRVSCPRLFEPCSSRSTGGNRNSVFQLVSHAERLFPVEIRGFPNDFLRQGVPDSTRVNSIIVEIPCNNYARTFRTARTSSFRCSSNPGGGVIKPLITLLLFLSHKKECERCPRCPEAATAGLFGEKVNSVRLLSDMSEL